MGHNLWKRGVQADIRENQKESDGKKRCQQMESPNSAIAPRWPRQNTHGTTVGEWETIPRGLDGILYALEQLPLEGLGKGLT